MISECFKTFQRGMGNMARVKNGSLRLEFKKKKERMGFVKEMVLREYGNFSKTI